VGPSRRASLVRHARPAMTPVRGSYGLVMPAPITGAPPAINERCEGRIVVVGQAWSVSTKSKFKTPRMPPSNIGMRKADKSRWGWAVS
jgi:hypothetical protein